MTTLEPGDTWTFKTTDGMTTTYEILEARGRESVKARRRLRNSRGRVVETLTAVHRTARLAPYLATMAAVKTP